MPSSVLANRSQSDLTALLVTDLEALGTKLYQYAMSTTDSDIRAAYIGASSSLMMAARKCSKHLHDWQGETTWLLEGAVS